ncbi:MAG TPA: PA14 domain-containing protein,virulence plasmid 28 protein [Nitrospiraceae bacterium]|nr:PA14 domain-containing protein,virulence plasmid 28 protein [Nitrospiraceae bacterium]
MDPVTFPLQRGDEGPAVANLQQALLLLIDKEVLRLSANLRPSLRESLVAENSQKKFESGTAKTIGTFQEQYQLPSTSQVDAATSEAINRVLRELGVLTPDQNSLYRVDGKVVSRVRAGVGGLQVRLVDKHVGTDVRLADTQTDAGGSYHITFSIPDLQERGKQRPDLQACVFLNDAFLGASAVRYNASYRETLHVVLGQEADAKLYSEYDTLTQALGTHYPGRLGDLKEEQAEPDRHDVRRDITYLANKTGWDARAVAFAALADQLSARSLDPNGGGGIAPPLFYALFRAGVPAGEQAVYQLNPDRVAGIWKHGMAEGLIPAMSDRQLSQAAKRFQILAVDHALKSPALTGLSSLKEMLSVSLGRNPTKHQQFADLHTKYRDDPSKLWEKVRSVFGAQTEKRLKVDGQLAALTLNNAPLVKKLHGSAGRTGVTDPKALIAAGYYKSEVWRTLNGTDAIPPEIPEIPGERPRERRERYADLLAAQMRLSYPTAVVAQMVKNRETPVSRPLLTPVHRFLLTHEDTFAIGRQPVEQFVKQQNLTVEPEVIQEVQRIQRVYQCTPNDQAMNALLKKNVDSAAAVVRYTSQQFVETFQAEMGGEANARLTYAKAQQVHTAVVNMATSYLIARTAPAIGVHSPAGVIDPAPRGPSPAHPDDVLAYPTLEGLFGEMDYCACDHCRSILSPAAYLVNLLQFLSPEPDVWRETMSKWKRDHGGAPYPFETLEAWEDAESPTDTEKTPFDVLISRRPDLEQLELTCENTNIPLPYIDLVNETLEFYVGNTAHPLSLNGYSGHSTTEDMTPEVLLAAPQSVQKEVYKEAYKQLAEAHFPILLPFDQPLEHLRRSFARFDAPLSDVMMALRNNDSIDREGAGEYGWNDILMEELGLSRAAYAIFKDRSLRLRDLYGFAASDRDAAIKKKLSPAKDFARRVDLPYADLITMLKTRFINPHSTLIPKVERLGVSFSTLKKFKDRDMTGAEFEAMLPEGLDPSHYGGNIKRWVKDSKNYTRIMNLVTLANPSSAAEEDGAIDLCNFEQFEFRYANPDMTANTLKPIELYRMIHFLRLWKTLGWSMEQTDKAIIALFPSLSKAPRREDLVAGFPILLNRLGVMKRVMRVLNLSVQQDLLPLLACFAPIDTHGAASLYRRLFVTASQITPDSALADDQYGHFPAAPDEKLLLHAESLRAGCQLTHEEFTQITQALGFDADQILGTSEADLRVILGHDPSEQELEHFRTENISAIFRRGWLARQLKLSVSEFLHLMDCTGLDPFAAPDPPDPPILRFIDVVHRLRAASLKPTEALYLIWDQDLSGQSTPDDLAITAVARTLRSELTAIEREFTIVDDPDGQIARDKLALVYGSEASDYFFSLLHHEGVTDVEYTHGQATLEAAIVTAGQAMIAYDHLAHRLAYTGGVMPDAIRDALKGVAGVRRKFKAAVDQLHANSQSFFIRYPELRPPYDAFIASDEVQETKRATLLEKVLPALKTRRMQQQILQAVSAVGGVDLGLAHSLLDHKIDKTYVLHAVGDPARPAVDDLTAVGTTGLEVQWHYRNHARGRVDETRVAEADLHYSRTGRNRFPNPGGPVSGIWDGLIEAPENGPYRFSIECDEDATVVLKLDGKTVDLEQDGRVWRHRDDAPQNLEAGKLYKVKLTVENVQERLAVRWDTVERRGEVIPPQFLYGPTLRDHLRTIYVRFLKVASLATALSLNANEMAYLAFHADSGDGEPSWFNLIPVGEALAASGTNNILFQGLLALLDFARIKSTLGSSGEGLLTIMNDPGGATETPDGLLYKLTRWESDSLDALLIRFGKVTGANADRKALQDLNTFRRIFDAYAYATRLSISASALIQATTNGPTAETVRNFQSALRARHDENGWLKVLRPLNDEMRTLQRDALVAFILHRMREHLETAHINTPDKLFEYFLMDVQMDPCMQTSRIRHALSSVQLFIERCLMNLEPRVAPSAIVAKQWAWMKRYRVWEANRKIFLYPENWLEPELRDDQSPFFKETMSELLQSDITEDRAATALLNYLSKLEEVAKLEPCGLYHQEGNTGTNDDIVHVVARTAGANRKYFYRRREPTGWTAWELINLDIEDNPVIPVVWKGRLFLFWLKILKEAAPVTSSVPNVPGGLADANPADFISDEQPKLTVKAILCWSEYYNGKWQPSRTSDVDSPTHLGEQQAIRPDGFARSDLQLQAFERPIGLHITISNANFAAGGFLLYNTHSSPIAIENLSYVEGFGFGVGAKVRSLLVDLDNSLTVRYENVPVPGSFSTGQFQQRLLTNPRTDWAVQPTMIAPKGPDAPFFYADSRHVFYVTTTQDVVKIAEPVGYVMAATPASEFEFVPVLVFEGFPEIMGMIIDEPAVGIGRDPGWIDPKRMQQFVTKHPDIHIGIGMTGNVRYGDAEIGPAGMMTDGRPL